MQNAIAGLELEILAYETERSHYWVELQEEYLGRREWFIFMDHCEIIGRQSLPRKKLLRVPYVSQHTSRYNPHGSCNVASVAMCLLYFGIMPSRRNYPLIDELYSFMEWHTPYSRHNPYDLASVINSAGAPNTSYPGVRPNNGKKGVVSRFTPNGCLEDLKRHISQGNPCIIHGYFTPFGHIIVVVGYDENGLIVHDPYGEWFSSGYRTDLTGENLHYSYNLIRNTCIDHEFWVHYVSRR